MSARRVVIYGNAGSGKTTMARTLGLPVLSLDNLAWTAAGVRTPLADSLAALDQFDAELSGGQAGSLRRHHELHSLRRKMGNIHSTLMKAKR